MLEILQGVRKTVQKFWLQKVVEEFSFKHTKESGSEEYLVKEKPFAPYPQRLRNNRLDNQFDKFMEIFIKLHINIPFSEALEQMPGYVKFMKDILSKKRKLGD